MNKPLLTIGILTYYKEHRLDRILDSIVSQFDDVGVMENVEVVVSDDAGFGDAKATVEKYMPRFANIRFNRNAVNLGFDGNVDKLFSMAGGKYCWIMSDDDIMLPGALNRLLLVLNAHPEAVYICSATDEVVFPQSSDFKVLQDGKKLLEDYSFIGGLVSQNIFRMDSLPTSRKKYYGNLWFHFSVAYEMAAKGPVILTKTLLQEDPTNIVPRWTKGGKALTAIINLKNIVKSLVECGYSQRVVNNKLAFIAKNTPRTVASARLQGLESSPAVFKLLWREFGNYPMCLAESAVLLILPVGVLRNLKNLMKTLKVIK
jgi:glycosyltransferase involved in cell wall biosynthesis